MKFTTLKQSLSRALFREKAGKLFVFIVLTLSVNMLHARRIHWCARNNDVQGIIKWQAYKDQVDENSGYKPIHYAAQYDQLKALETLVGLKASINSVTLKEYATALHLGAQFGGPGIIWCLLKNGANINAQDKVSSATPIHYAIYANNITTFRILLHFDQFRFDVVDRYGRNALHWAVMNCKPLMVKEVLAYMNKNGIQDMPDLSGYTALAMAQQYLDDITPYQDQDEYCRNRFIDYTNIVTLFSPENNDIQAQSSSYAGNVSAKNNNKTKKATKELANPSSVQKIETESKADKEKTAVFNTQKQYDYLSAIKKGMQRQQEEDQKDQHGKAQTACVSTALHTSNVTSSSSETRVPSARTFKKEEQELKEDEWKVAGKKKNKQRAQALLAAASVTQTETQQEDEDENIAGAQETNEPVQTVGNLQAQEQEEEQSAITPVGVKKKKNKKKKNKKDDFDTIVGEFAAMNANELVTTSSSSYDYVKENREFVKSIKAGDLGKVVSMFEANNDIINYQDNTGKLPIHYAAMVKGFDKKFAVILEFLLTQNIQTFFIEDEKGQTAFALLKEEFNPVMVEHLIEIITNKEQFNSMQNVVEELNAHSRSNVEKNMRIISGNKQAHKLILELMALQQDE